MGRVMDLLPSTSIRTDRPEWCRERTLSLRASCRAMWASPRETPDSMSLAQRLLHMCAPNCPARDLARMPASPLTVRPAPRR